MKSLQNTVNEAVSRHTAKPFRWQSEASLGGGCIHRALRVQGTDGRSFFIKRNQRSCVGMFQTEAEALRKLAESGTLRVPEPVAVLETPSEAVLVLEFLPLGSRSGDWAAFGALLAALHRRTAESFGWPTDNWIGAAPQPNGWEADWLTFYREKRLMPQVLRARANGLKLPQAEQLAGTLPAFFTHYQPVPSLLHGDLWTGNAAFTRDGEPVVFDPAAYYGDREADLAMTELFGGFPRDFYEGYDEAWPLDSGYRVRRELYNLYHVLNHFNLFGGGYGTRAESMIKDLLAAARP